VRKAKPTPIAPKLLAPNMRICERTFLWDAPGNEPLAHRVPFLTMCLRVPLLTAYPTLIAVRPGYSQRGPADRSTAPP
jgi:hypothetical protein